MKSIYITEQKKKEIESKITELKNQKTVGDAYFIVYGTIQTLEQLLSQCIVLPVEESWYNVFNGRNKYYPIEACQNVYPKGVIISTISD